MFNPEESIEFQGQTGPFIQYTHARIKSILRSATDLNPQGSYADIKEEERDLAQMIFKSNDIIKEAADKMDPSHIANYAYELAKAFSSFYAAHSVMKEEDKGAQAFRIALCSFTAKTIEKMMNLLGIQVPERM
jgi:arginyl-tRNA synthetase